MVDYQQIPDNPMSLLRAVRGQTGLVSQKVDSPDSQGVIPDETKSANSIAKGAC